MSKVNLQAATAANYVLDMRSRMEEAGPVLATTFQATLEGARPGLAALARIDGLILGTEGQGDVFVRLGRPLDRETPCRLLDVGVGARATLSIDSGTDVTFHATVRRCVLLFGAIVISPDSRLRPGTRLLAALANAYAGEGTQVVADFLSPGDDEEDRDIFLESFFPNLGGAGLTMSKGDRFAHGFWGPRDTDPVERFRVGITYERYSGALGTP